VDGRPTFGDPAIYRRVGLVPEREAVFPYLTAREFVRLSAQLQGLPLGSGAVDRALERVELSMAADRELATYSKGMRQRAKVAAALVHDPAVLVLDEPFNGMDPRQRLHMMALLREFRGRRPGDPLLVAHPGRRWSASPNGCSWWLRVASPRRGTFARFAG